MAWYSVKILGTTLPLQFQRWRWMIRFTLRPF